MVAGLVLLKFPAVSLFRVMVMTAAGTAGRAVVIKPAPAATNAWLKNRTAALNLCTLISPALARENGTWALT